MPFQGKFWRLKFAVCGSESSGGLDRNGRRTFTTRSTYSSSQIFKSFKLAKGEIKRSKIIRSLGFVAAGLGLSSAYTNRKFVFINRAFTLLGLLCLILLQSFSSFVPQTHRTVIDRSPSSNQLSYIPFAKELQTIAFGNGHCSGLKRMGSCYHSLELPNPVPGIVPRLFIRMLLFLATSSFLRSY